MNDKMLVSYVIAALAIYANKQKGGIVAALATLLKAGLDIEEALSILEAYDRAEEAIKVGMPL